MSVAGKKIVEFALVRKVSYRPYIEDVIVFLDSIRNDSDFFVGDNLFSIRDVTVLDRKMNSCFPLNCCNKCSAM